jgi:hypothetical protein
MAGKIIQFDGPSFCKLLTHYTDGKVPQDFELKHVAMDTILKRQVAFIGESKNWQDEMLPGQEAYAPLMVRFEGKKVLSWGRKDAEVFWNDSPDAPKFQG